MKTISKGFFPTSLVSLFLILFCAVTSYGITYTTVQNGNWNSASTWDANGVPPTSSDIPSGDVINIRHTVAYNTGNPIKNRGTIRIQPVGGSTAILNVPTNINVENFAASPQGFYIINGSFLQCRFVPCNDGQTYSGNNPGATKQSGTFKNIGGFVRLDTADVEVAQDWTNESGGIREMVNSCVTTGQNFSSKGTGSMDTITNSFVSIGWHGSGNFEVADGTSTYDRLRIQLAGTSGNVDFSSGTVNGDIDVITLRNHIVPFIGGGKISASSSVTTTGINLDKYCVSNFSPGAGLFEQNGKFTGTRTQSCVEEDFPAACSTAPVLSAGAVIEGRVLTGKGLGIGRVLVELTGGDLSNPVRVFTDKTGAYKFENISVGHAYVITVSSRKFDFSNPSRVVTLQDNLTEFNFVADRSMIKRQRR